MFTHAQATAIQKRSTKIAQELLLEGADGWITAVAILGWMAGSMKKSMADELTRDLINEVRKFPTYPKD